MNRHKAGMLFFIASEVFFFLTLIFSYIYLSHSFGSFPRTYLAVPRTFVFSLFLFSSSATLYLAERAYARGRAGAFRALMLLTVALGLVFLVGQGIEYTELIRNGVTVDFNVFGSAFFTLTGFHGLHVVTGLIMLLSVTGLSFAGRLDGSREIALTTVAYYWHFVDAVWVAVFSVAYLLLR